MGVALFAVSSNKTVYLAVSLHEHHRGAVRLRVDAWRSSVPLFDLGIIDASGYLGVLDEFQKESDVQLFDHVVVQRFLGHEGRDLRVELDKGLLGPNLETGDLAVLPEDLGEQLIPLECLPSQARSCSCLN